MTVANVITTIRWTLNDSDSGDYRWTDAALIRYVSDAQQFLYSIRPDLFLDATGTVTAPSNLTATGDSLSVDEHWRPFLQAYACSRALEDDITDNANAKKADEYMTLAMRHALGIQI